MHIYFLYVQYFFPLITNLNTVKTINTTIKKCASPLKCWSALPLEFNC